MAPCSQAAPSPRSVATACLPRHGADLVGLGCQRYAQPELEVEGGVRRSLDGEFLEQRCEEEEELGACQQLTQAGTFPCGDSHPPSAFTACRLVFSAKKASPCRSVTQPTPPCPRHASKTSFAPKLSFPRCYSTGCPQPGWLAVSIVQLEDPVQ